MQRLWQTVVVCTGIPPWLSMAPVYVWMLIFFTRPHKVRNVEMFHT